MVPQTLFCQGSLARTAPECYVCFGGGASRVLPCCFVLGSVRFPGFDGLGSKSQVLDVVCQ